LNWEPTERLKLQYAFAAGENRYKFNEFDGNKYDTFIHSLNLDYQISSKWQYGIEWSYMNLSVEQESNTAFALCNEIIYQYNKNWAFGTRLGLLGNNVAATANLDLPAGDWYMVTLGANWTPNKWLTVKPEVRYDWIAKAADTPFNNEASSYQFSGGLSAVVAF
jgi:hypothetical protein